MTKQLATTLLLGLLIAGCGEKAQEMKEAAEGIKTLAENAENMQKAADNMKQATDEGEQFMKERAAKGDTIAMPYTELQKFLPTSIDGYKLDGEPGGSQQSMTGFSLSVAEQQWVSTSGDPNNPARIKVALQDYGGTSGAYGFYGLMFAMNMQQEDNSHKMRTYKMDIPYTNAMEEFRKDSKDSKITVGTRYRYLINIEATNQTEDQTKMVTDIATQIAKNLDGK